MPQLFAHLLQTTNTPVDEPFNLFLFSLLLLGLVFVALCCLIALIITLCLLLIIAACIGIGVLSVSIWVGIKQKSATQGFKFFVIGLSTSIFGLMGTLVIYILNRITHWLEPKVALIVGLSIGIVGGLVSGYLMAKAIGRLIDFFKRKMYSYV